MGIAWGRTGGQCGKGGEQYLLFHCRMKEWGPTIRARKRKENFYCGRQASQKSWEKKEAVSPRGCCQGVVLSEDSQLADASPPQEKKETRVPFRVTGGGGGFGKKKNVSET